jgi:hypothetical protein
MQGTNPVQKTLNDMDEIVKIQKNKPCKSKTYKACFFSVDLLGLPGTPFSRPG